MTDPTYAATRYRAIRLDPSRSVMATLSAELAPGERVVSIYPAGHTFLQALIERADATFDPPERTPT